MIINFLEVNNTECQLLDAKPDGESRSEERIRRQVLKEVRKQIHIMEKIMNDRYLSLQPEIMVEAN